jgi:general secretion pathway protein F
LKNFPDVFPSIYIAMITAGETAGVLDTVLDRIADFLDKEEELRYRIQSALAYPLMLLAVGCASVLFLLGFVIPKFELMFQDLGQAMPLPTQILISISHIVRYWWWAYMPIALVAAVSIFRWYSTRTGKLFFSNAKLKLPVIGGFLRKDMVAKFLRMLSILLTNGVPILDALSIARNSIDNLLFSNDIDRICAAVEDGQGLSASIAQSTLFPSMVYEMIAVGEETGKMESSLSRVADMYEREVEYAIKTMTSLLEPAIILFAGIIVCLIALSMLLPVFQVSAGIR